MKLKMYFFAVAFSCLGTTNYAQFIREYTLPGGFVQNQPVDANYNLQLGTWHSLHSGVNGDLQVLRYNAALGTLVSADLTATYFMDPVAMINRANRSVVLFNFGVGSQAAYGICMFNHTTNTLIWTNCMIDADPNVSITATDIDFDPLGQIYVLGTLYDNGSGRQEMYVAQWDAATGSLNWDISYGNITLDFESRHIDFYSPNSIYLSAAAYDPMNPLTTRGAHFMNINSAGAINSNRYINYDANVCPQYRLTIPTIKRDGNQVFALCPSIVGHDGNGIYFLADLDPITLAINNYTIYDPQDMYFNNYVAPWLEFVNMNGTNAIMVTGARTQLNGPTNGYVHCFFDYGTNYISGRHYYPTDCNPFAGGPMIDAYDPNNNIVFTVAEDQTNPTYYYGLKTNSDGTIDTNTCDSSYYQPTYPCKLLETVSFMTHPYRYNVASPYPMKLKQMDVLHQPVCGPQAFMEKSTSQTMADLVIYPNPATEETKIQSTTELSFIELVDLQGKIIKTLSPGNISNETILSLKELSPGIYYVRITYVDQHQTMHKLLKY